MAYRETLQYIKEVEGLSDNPLINLEIEGHDHTLANGTTVTIRAEERMWFSNCWKVKVEIGAIEQDAGIWCESESYWIPIRHRGQTSMRRSNFIAAIERANTPTVHEYDQGRHDRGY